MTSDNTAPDKPAAPPRETLAGLGARLDMLALSVDQSLGHTDEQYHEIIRKLDRVLADQAQLLEMIRPYLPLLEKLAASPAAKLLTGTALTRLRDRHTDKKGTPPDG
jgi:hypothetical protein